MQTQWALSWLPGNLFHALQGSLHFRIWSGFLKLWVICMTVKLGKIKMFVSAAELKKNF